jgi:DNA/RNA endonuclease G (NUC1)
MKTNSILIKLAILLVTACSGSEAFKPGKVNTGEASNLTTSSAVLKGGISGFSAAPRECGFIWGRYSDKLDRTVQSQDMLNSGSGDFSALIDGLSDDCTYYYRAYIVVWVDGEGNYFYGDICSFTTPEEEDIPDPGPGPGPGPDQPGSTVYSQAGWYELPVMQMKKDGDYLVGANNSDLYYAYHMCAGGEKGPGGKTARNYTVCVSAKYHCPLWVAAPRHSMYVGKSGRNDSYRVDDKIPAFAQYKANEAGGSCNRGHMLGSAERTSSVETNKQVFFFPNIAPQLSGGFNTGGGGWNTLEDWVDGQVCSDTLYIVIGCYFDEFTDAYNNNVKPKRISYGGWDDTGFPTMFYYLLMRTKSGNSGKALKDCSAAEIKCAAFVRSHTNSLKGQSVTSREMMSVSDLEKITGFTYFPNVPNAPKDSFSAADWGLQ